MTAVLVVLMNYVFTANHQIAEMDYSTFKRKLENGEIKRLELTPRYYVVFTITGDEV